MDNPVLRASLMSTAEICACPQLIHKMGRHPQAQLHNHVHFHRIAINVQRKNSKLLFLSLYDYTT